MILFLCIALPLAAAAVWFALGLTSPVPAYRAAQARKAEEAAWQARYAQNLEDAHSIVTGTATPEVLARSATFHAELAPMIRF